MASAIKCDKCGTTSAEISDFMHIRAYKMVSATRYNTGAEKYFDLCKKCYDEFLNFVKESEDK